MDPMYFSLFCGLSALLYGVIISKTILTMPPGDNKMQEISENMTEIVYKNDAGIITISGLDKLDKNKILSDYYAS